jgi:hypothetical protein
MLCKEITRKREAIVFSNDRTIVWSIPLLHAVHEQDGMALDLQFPKIEEEVYHGTAG